MHLLIVILNYRTSQLTIDCLYSLIDQVIALPSTKVVVTDNSSGDNSVELIAQTIEKEGWSNWVELIALEHNGGYAFGNNAGIRPFLESLDPPDYVLLLNPDTIVRDNAIKILLDFMEENRQVGIAGSRLEHPDGIPQCSSFRFHSILSELDNSLSLGIISTLLAKWIVAPPVPENSCQTDWVPGASMIIRRAVLEEAGLIDENYFMYYEDADFCLQANRVGWLCWYVPASRVVHLVGQSSGINENQQTNKRRPKYWFEARRRYFVKNHGWLYAVLVDIVWILGFILWQLGRVIQGKPNDYPPYFFRDFLKNSILLINNWSNSQNTLANNLAEGETEQISLCQQIKEDWIAHEKDWTRPGFQAVAVQRFGVWRMKIKSKFFRSPFSVIYRMLYRFIRNFYGIELPYTVKLGRRVIFEHQSGIVIHGCCFIGDDSIIRQGVTLGNRYLEKPLEAPHLGQRVNVGAGAKILGALNIGDDVSIGANAVVLSDIPNGQTAVGIPAKIISFESKENIPN